MAKQKEWFVDWFGSPYYPILYKNRNEQEAKLFISVLIDHLDLTVGDKVLDLACGRGRHSLTLHQMGLDVTGFDISEERIAEAREHKSANLSFVVHDMREPFPVDGLDAIFNFFTSFGYFENVSENIQVLLNVQKALRSGGKFVLDYLNVARVISELVPEEIKIVDGIEFHIKKTLRKAHIRKEINFKDKGNNFRFLEFVEALELVDFERMLKQSGFRINAVWGNYEGAPYAAKDSPRLIILAEKYSL